MKPQHSFYYLFLFFSLLASVLSCKDANHSTPNSAQAKPQIFGSLTLCQDEDLQWDGGVVQYSITDTGVIRYQWNVTVEVPFLNDLIDRVFDGSGKYIITQANKKLVLVNTFKQAFTATEDKLVVNVDSADIDLDAKKTKAYILNSGTEFIGSVVIDTSDDRVIKIDSAEAVLEIPLLQELKKLRFEAKPENCPAI